MVEAVHGGDARRAAAHYGVDAESLLDFSANIDPFGPPEAVRDVLERAARNPRMLSGYPTERDYTEARVAIAMATRVEADAVVLGPGGAALIDTAIRCVDANAVVVPVPAFSEYARAIAAAGKRFVECRLDAEFSLDVQAFSRHVDGGAAGLLNSPHNPSGSELSAGALQAAVDACDARAQDLIIDEAFVDYVPERSVARLAATSARTIVLRSLTKFYALAGVRIGFAILHPDRARRFRALQPSWPVGRLELEIARALHRDTAYATQTRAQNTGEREWLATSLRNIGVTVFPSVANFLLLDLPCPSLDPLLAGLVRDHGVVVRDCRTYRGLETRSVIRVAVLDAKSNARLVVALRETLNRI